MESVVASFADCRVTVVHRLTHLSEEQDTNLENSNLRPACMSNAWLGGLALGCQLRLDWLQSGRDGSHSYVKHLTLAS